VPRFYFDVREGSRFIPDDEGLEFDDVDAAERETVEVAAAIGRDQLAKGDTREVTVEVRNEHSQRVLTATASMHIDRVVTPPGVTDGQTPLGTSQAGVLAAAKLLT